MCVDVCRCHHHEAAIPTIHLVAAVAMAVVAVVAGVVMAAAAASMLDAVVVEVVESDLGLVTLVPVTMVPVVRSRRQVEGR